MLELCPHGDIFTLMKNVNKKLELAKKKRKIMTYYLAQILEVLDYLHAHQIVHRDLKVTAPPLSPKTSCSDPTSRCASSTSALPSCCLGVC